MNCIGDSEIEMETEKQETICCRTSFDSNFGSVY